MNPQEFLETMFKSINVVNHESDECMLCHYRRVCSDVAGEMLMEPVFPADVLSVWIDKIYYRLRGIKTLTAIPVLPTVKDDTHAELEGEEEESTDSVQA